MFRMRVYRVKGEVLVAVCDPELVGKTYSEGGYRIEVKEEFYGQEEFDEDVVKKALENATIANITGKKAVDLAIRIGIVDSRNVLKIGDCWHAQMVTL